MSETRTLRRAELTREDLDALDRFTARLRAIDGDPYECSVAIEAWPSGDYHVCAKARALGPGDGDHASIVSRATRTTVGAALCEAARRIGVAL